VKRLQSKIWFVLVTGLAEDLTQVVFRWSSVIPHVRTRSLNCETGNFWCFYVLMNMKLICDLWCYYCFPLAALVLFHDLGHKNAWINHSIVTLYKKIVSSLKTITWESSVSSISSEVKSIFPVPQLNTPDIVSGFSNCTSELKKVSNKVFKQICYMKETSNQATTLLKMPAENEKHLNESWLQLAYCRRQVRS